MDVPKFESCLFFHMRGASAGGLLFHVSLANMEMEAHFSPNSLLLEFYLRKKKLATLTGRTLRLRSVAGLCVQTLSSSCPLWLGSVAGLCVQALSSSCPPLGRAPELCGWALCPALSSSCPPLGRALNSAAGLCGPALCPGLALLLSSSWPRP